MVPPFRRTHTLFFFLGPRIDLSVVPLLNFLFHDLYLEFTGLKTCHTIQRRFQIHSTVLSFYNKLFDLKEIVIVERCLIWCHMRVQYHR